MNIFQIVEQTKIIRTNTESNDSSIVLSYIYN